MIFIWFELFLIDSNLGGVNMSTCCTYDTCVIVVEDLLIKHVIFSYLMQDVIEFSEHVVVKELIWVFEKKLYDARIVQQHHYSWYWSQALAAKIKSFWQCLSNMMYAIWVLRVMLLWTQGRKFMLVQLLYLMLTPLQSLKLERRYIWNALVVKYRPINQDLDRSRIKPTLMIFVEKMENYEVKVEPQWKCV